MTLCPGKYQPVASTGSWDRQLDMDVDALVEMDVVRLISLVTDEDMRVLRVEALPQEVQSKGLIWNHLPFADTTAPDDAWMKEAMPVMARIITEIPEGSKVVVHCMGGLSRAGTFASIYLWMRGSEMEDAIATVRDFRSPNAINHRQVRFLMALANGHNGGLHDSEGSA